MTIIGTNQFFDRAASRLSALQNRTQTLQTQISTQKKLAAPSDDAVAYRRLQRIAQGSADDVASGKNIDLAKTVVGQADTALDSINNQVQKAQELVVQASSGTVSLASRKVIAGQLREIVNDLVSLANTRDARGGPLFGAATGTTGVTLDAAGVVSFDGTGAPATIPIGDGNSIQPSDSAERIFGNLADGSGGTTDAFAILSNIATALEAGGAPSSAVGPGIDGIKAALDQINDVRGSVGARGARLDLATAQLQSTATGREIERSGLEDTDLNAAAVDLQKTATVLQATQASLAKLSSLSLFDYLK